MTAVVATLLVLVAIREWERWTAQHPTEPSRRQRRRAARHPWRGYR